jgi:hypothetical protein
MMMIPCMAHQSSCARDTHDTHASRLFFNFSWEVMKVVVVRPERDRRIMHTHTYNQQW